MELVPTNDLSARFREIFEAEFGYVSRSLRRLGVRNGDVQDVAQEVFLAVHEHIRDYDPLRPIRRWLFSFCLRFAANYRRLARHRAVQSQRGPTNEHPELGAEARDVVLRGLSEVEFERRCVLVMHDIEGFGALEIGEQMNVPLNTVYSRLRLARAEFRDAVERLQRKGATP